MNINSRIQAAIEIINLIQIAHYKPADTIMREYFKTRRFIGSSDRRVIGDIVFSILRHYHGLVECLSIEEISSRLLAFLFLILHEKYDVRQIKELCVGPYAPEHLSTAEENSLINTNKYNPYLLPIWIESYVEKELVPYLFEPACVDVRVNTLKAKRNTVIKRLLSENFEVIPTPYSPVGLRFNKRLPLHTHELWLDGTLEIQEEASQIASLLCDAKPGMQILDYCSGAGGKSLSMAACMNNHGTLILSDISASRLNRSKARLKRAQVFNYQIKNITTDQAWFKRNKNHFDRVLTDVPCSGTGTWRRNPDLKMRFLENSLKELLDIQKEIITNASKLVKPGGRLIYATCSFLKCENEDQIENFLENNKEFSVIPINKVWKETINSECPFENNYANFLTNKHGTDCFFVCVMEKELKLSN